MSRKKKITLIALWGIAVILVICAAYISFVDCGYTEVCFIDVGQGDSCFIKSDQGDTVLIDGGDDGSGKYILKSFLRKHSTTDLDAVFISHIHDDHTEGILELMENFYPIGTIYMSEKAPENDNYGEIKSLAHRRGVEIKLLRDEDGVEIDNLKFKVVSSGYDGESDENDNSLIIRMDYGENSFLFTGDATRKVETTLLGRDDIDVDFLKIGHHGSYTSSGEEFLRKVSPSLAIISVGKDNRYGHPSKQTMKTIDKLDIPVMRTDYDGTISIIMTEDDIKNITASRERSEEYED